MTPDELIERLLTSFVGELEEQVAIMNADLLALEAKPDDRDRLKSLFRVAHTLKGAARATGQQMIEQTCHELESLLVRARDGRVRLGPSEISMLFSAADALADARERLIDKRSFDGSPIAILRDQLLTPDGQVEEQAESDEESVWPLAGASSVGAPSTSGPPSAEAPDRLVRIEAGKLDGLLAGSGQLMVASTRVAERSGEARSLHAVARRWEVDWKRSSRRLHAVLAASGASPALMQVVHGLDEQVRRLVHDANRLATKTREDARILDQITSGLAGDVRRLRLRPVNEACDSLPRVVRDLAATVGKEVDLRVEADGVEADRAVLDGLRDALLQLVRNAVDHGIEAPDVRMREGKEQRATIVVSAELSGGRLIVTVQDDGAGLDIAGIRSKLSAAGREVPAADSDVAAELFRGGVSTRGEATAISGRGVGLDIVRAAVERVRGTVSVAWSPGGGTTFTIECPPTLATTAALLVGLGSQVVAVPTSFVERLVRVLPEDVRQAEGRDVIVMSPGAPVPLVPLVRLLPPLATRPEPGPIPVIVLRAGGKRLAVAVDRLIAEQELVVRPVWRGQQPLPHVSGAAILGTGRAAVVLNPVAIVAAGLGIVATPQSLADRGRDPRARKRIIVADDSITTRTLEQSILEAAGYEVETAVDGAAAWTLLQERGCDLVVSDVEMPRMDGFALCETIRKSKRFRELPLVLVTALESTEDRSRGLDAGADAYLTKGSFDQQRLLETIRQLLGESGR